MNGGLFGEMAVHVGDERLDGLRRRGPGCYQANGGMFGIHFGPDIKCVVLLQLFNQPMRRMGKIWLVGDCVRNANPASWMACRSKAAMSFACWASWKYKLS